MKTFLQLVNNTLVGIREDAVADVAQDDYTSMVAKFVNDAKQQVEDAYDWSAYITEYDITTVANQDIYSLVGSDNRVKMDFIIDITTGGIIREGVRKVLSIRALKANQPAGIADRYANNGVDANGDAQIRLFPAPSDVRTLTTSGWWRPTDLVTNDDTLLIPHAPVQDLALAMAVRERGEVAGQVAMEYFEIAKRSLSDAIAYDSARNDEETTWYVQ
jgi:hypothetical protein